MISLNMLRMKHSLNTNLMFLIMNIFFLCLSTRN